MGSFAVRYVEGHLCAFGQVVVGGKFWDQCRVLRAFGKTEVKHCCVCFLGQGYAGVIVPLP